jgi:hypothetical protein
MWFSHAKEGEPFTPPRNAPDRGEGILISGEDASGDLRTMIFEIRRRQGSKPWLEGPEVMTDVSGRFTNMFAVGPYL